MRKVTLADDYTTPGHSEALIDVFIESTEGDEVSFNSNEFIIEPIESFKDTYQLQMTATLVDNQTSVTSKIGAQNPFSNEVVLRQDSIVGCAEPIIETPVIHVEEEDSDLCDNTNICRKRFQKVDDPYLHSRRKDGKAMPKTIIPSHLKDVFEKTTKECGDKEKATMQIS